MNTRTKENTRFSNSASRCVFYAIRASGATCYTLRATRMSRGIATLELLIAFALAVVLLVGATMVSFGGQTAALDSQLTSQGLSKAATHVASTTAGLVAGWSSIESVSVPDTEDNDPFYQSFFGKTYTVTDVSSCRKDISTNTGWISEKNRGQNIGFQTSVVSIEEAKKLGGDCPPFSPLSWSNIIKATFIGHGGGNGSDTITGIDVKGNTMVMTGVSSAANKNDLYLYKVVYTANPVNPVQLDPPLLPAVGEMDFNAQGLNAVDIGYNSLRDRDYAYVANNDGIAGQLQVVDISTSSLSIYASVTLPDITPGYVCSNPSCAVAKSIYFYDNKVYVGTPYLFGGASDENNELHIFNVIDPINPQPLDRIDVGRSVNDIIVRNDLAYLATGQGTPIPPNPFIPLKIFDINPVSATYKQEIGYFPSPDNKRGLSVYVLGDYLYFGREDGGTNFFIFDITNPAGSLDSKIVGGIPVVGDINDIFVTGDLAFLATEDGLYVYDVRNPSMPRGIFTQQPVNNGTNKIDYDGKYIYASANKTSNGLMAILCSAIGAVCE